MSGYAGGPEEHSHHVSSPISVPWVVLASVISAVGLTLVWWGATTDAWPYFVAGPFVVFISVLMFLNPRAGLDHA